MTRSLWLIACIACLLTAPAARAGESAPAPADPPEPAARPSPDEPPAADPALDTERARLLRRVRRQLDAADFADPAADAVESAPDQRVRRRLDGLVRDASELVAITPRGPERLEAINVYLQGQYLLVSRWPDDPGADRRIERIRTMARLAAADDAPGAEPLADFWLLTAGLIEANRTDLPADRRRDRARELLAAHLRRHPDGATADAAREALARLTPPEATEGEAAGDAPDADRSPPPADAPPADLAPYFQPPDDLANDPGDYRSPLVFEDGRPVETAEQWPARRREIRDTWLGFIGDWPPLLDAPRIEYLEEERRDAFTQHTVRVEVAPDGRTLDGYLLVPHGDGPFPAVLVPFYDAEAGAGLRDSPADFAHQLAERGFVALSIGASPHSHHYPDRDAAALQPLSYMAYIAVNCHTALANMERVDGERIGIVGHSYGAKWAMFAACLHEPFAAAAWSDPGIVFDESRSNVNYWEPWYLGHEPGEEPRDPGLPADDNPRTGAYKRLVEAGRDLHELHALMAPRPFLVSGGSEDPPQRWRALNHARAVNDLLGREHRVAMTNRETHAPTPESNERVYRFFEHFLKRHE